MPSSHIEKKNNPIDLFIISSQSYHQVLNSGAMLNMTTVALSENLRIYLIKEFQINTKIMRFITYSHYYISLAS